MASDPAFCDDVTARLTPMGPVVGRRMFGGFGIFLDGLMFGLIAHDALWLKVDDANRGNFTNAGSRPFTYEGKSRPVEMSYWLVPDDVFTDPTALLDWAGSAHAAAQRAKRKSPPKRKKRG